MTGIGEFAGRLFGKGADNIGSSGTRNVLENSMNNIPDGLSSTQRAAARAAENRLNSRLKLQQRELPPLPNGQNPVLQALDGGAGPPSQSSMDAVVRDMPDIEKGIAAKELQIGARTPNDFQGQPGNKQLINDQGPNDTEVVDGVQKSKREIFVMETLGKGKTGWDTTTKVLLAGGIGVGIYTAYLSAKFDATNNKYTKVKNITITKGSDNSKKNVKVIFDKDDISTDSNGNNKVMEIQKKNFTPCRGDSIEFFGMTGRFPSGNSFIVKKAGPNFVEFEALDVDITGFNDASPAPCVFADIERTPSSPCSESYDDTAKRMCVYTSFGSQALDDVDDLFQNLADLLANILAGTINNLLPILLNAALNVGDAAGGAAKGVFCRTVPIVCDKSFWIILLAAFVGLIIISVVFSKRRTE